MKTMKSFALLAALATALGAPVAANAAVDVSFTNPDKFVDASPRGYRSDKERNRVMDQIRQHLEKQGARYLKPSQSLQIEVLDIDLAGRVEWWRHNAHDIRIIRDIDSPSMKLRYTLSENGQTLATGEERVRDLGYLMGINVTLGSHDPLKYEKTMLNDWFRKRFAKFGA